MQRRPANPDGAPISIEGQTLAVLSRLRRPQARLRLGLVALLAGPLLAGLSALFPRPLLGLRLPALVALPLLALAHRSSYRNDFSSIGPCSGLPSASTICLVAVARIVRRRDFTRCRRLATAWV